jgi:hypothetical protein
MTSLVFCRSQVSGYRIERVRGAVAMDTLRCTYVPNFDMRPAQSSSDFVYVDFIQPHLQASLLWRGVLSLNVSLCSCALTLYSAAIHNSTTLASSCS